MKKRRLQRLAAIILSAVLLCSFAPSAAAEGDRSVTRAVVYVSYDSYLNVRSGPGVNYDIVGSLQPDEEVSVLGMESDAEGVTWYQVQSDYGVTGYVHSEYIRIEGDAGIDTPTDMEFEALLDQQGFPESYRSRLRRLHEEYPNWVFVAQHTGLDWDTAVGEESILGRNLVYYTVPNSWKSYEEGAYNPVTQSWTGYDGEAWVCASREAIAYFMDPRNFLDHTTIFQFEALSYNRDAHTIAGVKSIIDGSFMDGRVFTGYDGKTYTFAEAIMKAADYSDVSPFYLASRVLMEQGSSGSPLSSGTYPGFGGIYNFFNIGAYTANGYGPVYNGLSYAASSGSYMRPWDNQLKALEGGAQFLAEDYIQYGQDTMYLHKFDVVDGGDGYYAHQYMTSVQAPSAEAVAFKAAYTDKMLDSSLVFKIPVYENMPDSVSPRPSIHTNGNTLLNSLSVNGVSASDFFAFTQNYVLTVDPSVTSVEIAAIPNSSASEVAGTGTVAVPEDGETLSITVTASNGNSRVYLIKVHKQAGAALKLATEEGQNPYPTIQRNDSGSAVAKLQSWLNELGYNCGTVDGEFGWGTAQAVVSFQKDHALTADGIVGPSTWKALEKALSETPEKVDITNIETIAEGSEGELVKTAQTLLNALGYSMNEDGVFGAEMKAAVEQFQQEQALTVSGEIDRFTWKALYEKNGYEVTDHTEPDPDDPVDVSSYPDLRYNSNGEYVVKLQKRLNELGYNCGAADGDFGVGTAAAVRQFQSDHNLIADGMVGQQTWKALYKNEEAPDPDDPDNPDNPDDPVDVSSYPDLRYNSNGEYVVKLQKRLNELGYNCGAADGDFGVGTAAAVRQFQSDHNLIADGMVGQQTWKALYENEEAPDPDDPDDPDNPDNPDNPDGPVDVTSYPEIYYGVQNRSEYVKILQTWLNQIGYDCGVVDGDFGVGTQESVRNFQKDAGLTADGIVGQATWKMLSESAQ